MSKGPVGANGNKPMLAWRGGASNDAKVGNRGVAAADASAQSKEGFTIMQRSGKPRGVNAQTDNRWAVFAEDQNEDGSDLSDIGDQEPLDPEEYREDARMEADESGELDGEGGDNETEDYNRGGNWEGKQAQEEDG